MTVRRAAAWVLAAFAVTGIAFAVGSATAPQATPSGAPSTAGPRRIDVPLLGKAAALPALHEEASVPVSAIGAEVSGSEVTEAPPAEAPSPVETPSPAEAPASPSPSPGSEVVPDGL